MDERRARQAEFIGPAVGEAGKQTFLDSLRDRDVMEIWLPAFSLETLRDEIEDIVLERLSDGCKIRILIHSKELYVRFEGKWIRSSAIEQLNRTLRWTRAIKARVDKRYARHLEVRALPDQYAALGYFSGLLTFSDQPGRTRTRIPKRYRVNIHEKATMRGTTGRMLIGEGNTTLFRILQFYFDQAWQRSFPLEASGSHLRMLWWNMRQLRIPILESKGVAVTLTMLLTLMALVAILQNANIAVTLLTLLLGTYSALFQIWSSKTV